MKFIVCCCIFITHVTSHNLYAIFNNQSKFSKIKLSEHVTKNKSNSNNISALEKLAVEQLLQLNQKTDPIPINNENSKRVAARKSFLTAIKHLLLCRQNERQTYMHIINLGNQIEQCKKQLHMYQQQFYQNENYINIYQKELFHSYMYSKNQQTFLTSLKHLLLCQQNKYKSYIYVFDLNSQIEKYKKELQIREYQLLQNENNLELYQKEVFRCYMHLNTLKTNSHFSNAITRIMD